MSTESVINFTSFTDNKLFRKVLSQNAGHIAESLARALLLSQGFQVERLSIDPRMHYSRLVFAKHERGMFKGLPDYRNVLAFKGAVGFFKDERVNEFYKKLYSLIRETSKTKTRKYNLGTKPDFIAKKEDRFYVIDVKTGKARLKPNQMKALQLADKFGLIPCLLHFDIDIEVMNASLLVANSENMTKLYPRKWASLTKR